MWVNQMTIEKPLQIRHYANRKADDVSADEQSTRADALACHRSHDARRKVFARALSTPSTLSEGKTRVRSRGVALGWRGRSGEAGEKIARSPRALAFAPHDLRFRHRRPNFLVSIRNFLFLAKCLTYFDHAARFSGHDVKTKWLSQLLAHKIA